MKEKDQYNLRNMPLYQGWYISWPCIRIFSEYFSSVHLPLRQLRDLGARPKINLCYIKRFREPRKHIAFCPRLQRHLT